MAKLTNQALIDALPIGQIRATHIGVEQRIQLVATRIRDAGDRVGVHDVLNQRNVLITDALDVVRTVAVIEHGRALSRLDGNDAGAVFGLEVVARC